MCSMADEINSKFEQAADYLPHLIAKNKMSDEVLLYLYARFKQATEGKCGISKPSFFEFQARKKYDAWISLADMTKEPAQKQYIEKITQLDPGWNDEQDSDGSDPNRTPATAGKKQSWVSVSSMAKESEEEIPEKEKTVFDWCQEGNLVQLKKSISKRSPILQLKDEQGLTVLHWACDRGHSEIVEFLLNAEADANSEDAEGQTPLHYACSCGHANIVRHLLANKADPRIKDNDGETAIDATQDEGVKKVLSTWNFWRGSGENL